MFKILLFTCLLLINHSILAQQIAPNQHRIAVASFIVVNNAHITEIEANRYADDFFQLMSDRFQRPNEFALIPPASVATTMQELNFTNVDRANIDRLVPLGNRLDVNIILLGQLDGENPTRLDLQFFNINTRSFTPIRTITLVSSRSININNFGVAINSFFSAVRALPVPIPSIRQQVEIPPDNTPNPPANNINNVINNNNNHTIHIDVSSFNQSIAQSSAIINQSIADIKQDISNSSSLIGQLNITVRVVLAITIVNISMSVILPIIILRLLKRKK